MKILFVCQQYIHAARWINQLQNSGHEIYVFDCLDMPIHEDLLWTNYITNWQKRKVPYFKGEYFLEKKIPKLFQKIEPYLKVTASEKLEELIKEIKPDLVHSLEMQSQSYHVLRAYKKVKFKWAYFSWGSDVYFFQHDKNHQEKIKEVLSKIDYFFADNQRDVQLAKELGYKQNFNAVFPGGGGYDLNKYESYIKPFLERKTILIKGYHHWAGRALVVLDALKYIVDDIKGYDIYVYSAHDIVITKIEELNATHNLNIQYSSRKNEISHEALLHKFGATKIAIGNSISDGIPNTLLEAIILGAFPIQSNPGGASEDYITHGENGLLISNAEDAHEISLQIKKALNSPELLESAYGKNQLIAQSLSYGKIQLAVLEKYALIASEI